MRPARPTRNTPAAGLTRLESHHLPHACSLTGIFAAEAPSAVSELRVDFEHDH
jgi:hypothetical protein